MAKIYTTLHPEGQPDDELYPNIDSRNIPDKSISKEKINNELYNLIVSGKSGSPSYVNTSTNILALNENKGLAVATDNGKWYYWDGLHYVDSGYQYLSSLDFDSYIPIINNVNNVVRQIEKTNISLTMDNNSYWDITIDDYTKVAKSSYTGLYKASQPISVNPNERYYIKVLQGNSGRQRGYAIVDSNYNRVFIPSSGYNVIDEVITIPENASYLLITNYYDGTIEPVVELVNYIYKPMASIDYVDNAIDYVSKNNYKYKNKYLSVMGDSFSAFSDYIPAGNRAYYFGNNAGVDSYSEMWWQKICDKLEMNRLIINGYSGSKVSNIDANVESYSFIPMSDNSRCSNLDDGVNTPDVIIILGGTNDFSKVNDSIGDVLHSKNLPTDNNNFANAYALMLSRIINNYPNAKIYCCSLPLFIRTNTNKNGIELTTEGKNVADYNKVIKETSELFNCSYIDLTKVSYNRNNYYPTYCEDNASTPTHPNKKGHEEIANVIINNMLK